MILGIDYGRAKIGLAIAEGSLASPLKVIRVKGWEDALEKVEKVVKVENVEQIVVGVSENEMGEEQEKFANELRTHLDVPVETQEETLSTKEAQEFAREAGIPQKKRQKMEDAYAATIVLQSWLDAEKSDSSRSI